MKRKTVLFVCSAGGHLTELVEIADAFAGMEKVLASYYEDKSLEGNVFERHYTLQDPFSPVRFFVVISRVVRILVKESPSVIVSTGSEITIPFFYLGKLLGAKLVYLECSAQVYTPSITGRIVNPITDLFLVQWKNLVGKYWKKARYAGGLI